MNCNICDNTRVRGFTTEFNRSDFKNYIYPKPCRACTTYEELYCFTNAQGNGTPLKDQDMRKYKVQLAEFIETIDPIKKLNIKNI